MILNTSKVKTKHVSLNHGVGLSNTLKYVG